MIFSRYCFKEMKDKGILHTKMRFCPSRASLFSLFIENSSLFLAKYESRVADCVLVKP